MNAWTTLISRLAVDRKPIPTPKFPKERKPQQRRSKATSGLTRKEICMAANASMIDEKRARRERSKQQVYAALFRPASAQEVHQMLGITYNYARELLVDLFNEGKVTRRKFSGCTYYYERVKCQG